MLLANLLLATTGRPANSYVQMDVMRLPLGILTGMGFIGAGTILRRGDLVIGVTTAATLWLATVIGLSIGAGEIGLGLVATALGFGILAGLALLERKIPQERRASLVVAYQGDANLQDILSSQLQAAGFAVTDRAVSFADQSHEARFDLRWRARPADVSPPGFLAELARRPEIRALRWDPLNRWDPLKTVASGSGGEPA
jgi:putative Mg2+ transporter-C (MgtC) family protein